MIAEPDRKGMDKKLTPPSPNFRLGHAYWSSPSAAETEDLLTVVRILGGHANLEPRVPTKGTAVFRAEELLSNGVRVIYTFSGCLHPKLGTIGLVISPDCMERSPHGVSRCDSGGLVGRSGSFASVKEEDVEKALHALSFVAGDNSWRPAFSDELAESYSNARAYVAGDIPKYDKWSDIRAQCIESHKATSASKPDRRLWTWEVRLSQPPHAGDYKAIVLSPEAFKRLESLRHEGHEIPEYVKVVHGHISASGIHYFEATAVTDLLSGADIAD